VGSTDGDKHARFTDLQAAKAMRNRNTMDAEPLVNLSAYFLHLCKRHRLISFVLKMERRPAMGLVAHETVEAYDGSVLARADLPHQKCDINGLVYQFKAIVGRRMAHGGDSSPADRGKKGDIVARSDGRLPGSKFLIARSHQRTPEACQSGVPGRVTVKQIGQGCAFGHFFKLFGTPHEFSDAPEKNHFDAKV